jgi:acetolactate synthase I/III small subunit
MMTRHTISLLVENHAGALSRISGLFSARGYNIESLSVAPTGDASISRMTIVTNGDDKVIEQIVKQLNKVIDVIKVWNLSKIESISRELILARVPTDDHEQDEILRIAQVFGAKVVDVSPNAIAMEMIGDEGEVENFLKALKPLGIKELIRSGIVAMPKESGR